MVALMVERKAGLMEIQMAWMKADQKVEMRAVLRVAQKAD